MVNLDILADDTLYTLKELEEHLGIPKANLQRYIREKGLKAITINKWQHISGRNMKSFCHCGDGEKEYEL